MPEPNILDPFEKRFALEIAQAIAAAAAADPRVEAWRALGRAAGLEVDVSAEGLAGLIVRVPLEKRAPGPPATPPLLEFTSTDRRFLKALRIAADEATERV